MKFQCGECDKFYKIDNNNVSKKDLRFKCENCGNYFSIKRDLSFSSSSKNSLILCGNCGKTIEEGNKSCPSCNFIFSKIHEELRVDNKYYELLEANEKGKVFNKNTGKNIGRRRTLISSALVIILIFSAATVYFLNNNPAALNTTSVSSIRDFLPERLKTTETQVVIMNSGTTYYAEKTAANGNYMEITSKNGIVHNVLKSDILQIAKATIED